MASEKEWLLLTAERYSREDALRVAQDSLTKRQKKSHIASGPSEVILLIGKTYYEVLQNYRKRIIQKGVQVR